jgi:hypothetical protein
MYLIVWNPQLKNVQIILPFNDKFYPINGGDILIIFIFEFRPLQNTAVLPWGGGLGQRILKEQ